MLDGRVLVFGGTEVGSEMYDPATGTWARTASYSIPRSYQSAVLLDGGAVLTIGGYSEDSSGNGLERVEMYLD